MPSRAKSEIVLPIVNPTGLLVVTQHATTGVLAVVDGVVYQKQADAMVALQAAADSAVADTRYLILRFDVLGGIYLDYTA